jgi:hypothetical protein
MPCDFKRVRKHKGKGRMSTCKRGSRKPNQAKKDVKVNVKFKLEKAMKAQRWSRGIAVLFL